MQYEYNAGVKSDGRTPTLWIFCKGQIHKFAGDAIPGIVDIVSFRRDECVRPACIVYLLEIKKGTPCHLLAFESKRLWPEDSLEKAHRRFCKQFGVKVSLNNFEDALARDFPLTYTRLYRGEEDPWAKHSRKRK